MTWESPWLRLRVHPAWLLLLFSPLLGLVQVLHSQLAGPGDLPFTPGMFLQILVGAALVAWLFAVGRPGRPPAGVWLAKELRAQLPGFLLAAAGPGVLACFVEGDGASLLYAPYFVGCCLLGASSFAGEFEQRTMAALLVQPVERARLYRLKLGVLGLLLALAALEAVLTGMAFEERFVRRGITGPGWVERFETFGVLPVLAFLTGPAFGLLSRSTPAAAVLIVGTPVSIGAVVSTGLYIGLRLRGAEEMGPRGEHLVWVAVCWLGAAYGIGLALLGWRLFQRLEVQTSAGGSGTGAPITVPGPLNFIRGVDVALARLLPAGPWASLLRKEIRLHAVPGLLFGLTLIFWVAWRAAMHFRPTEGYGTPHPGLGLDIDIPLTMLSGFLICLLAGIAALSEERQLGTLEWQLTSPVSVARQWWLKAVVALTVGLLFGCLAPLGYFAVFGEGQFGEDPVRPMVEGALVAALGLVSLGLYASTLAKDVIKSLCAALGVASCMAGIVLLVGSLTANRFQVDLSAPGEAWGLMLPRLERNADRPEELARLREEWKGQMAPLWLTPELSSNEMLSVSQAGVMAGVVVVSGLLLWRASRRMRRGFPGGGALAADLALVVGSVGLLSLALLMAGERLAVAATRGQMREGGMTWTPRSPASVAPPVTPMVPPSGRPPGSSNPAAPPR